MIDLAEDQYYLGRCFVTLKRHCSDLADLSEEEQKDFFEVLKNLEDAIKKSFGAVLFNWGCLMNNAFKEKSWNPHVHWHVRPRYDKVVDFSEIVFEDKEFGSHYQRRTDRKLPYETIKEIIDKIKSNLR